MNVKAYLKIKVTDENGKCIYYRRYRSRSFVIGFLNVIFTNLSGQGVTNTSTNGTQYTANIEDEINVNDSSNDDNYGIQIGTGTTTPSIVDSRLSSLITNGTGAGQMQYGGVNVTVSEVGAYANAGGTAYFILHDLLPSPITLSPNQVLTVVYTITIST